MRHPFLVEELWHLGNLGYHSVLGVNVCNLTFSECMQHWLTPSILLLRILSSIRVICAQFIFNRVRYRNFSITNGPSAGILRARNLLSLTRPQLFIIFFRMPLIFWFFLQENIIFSIPGWQFLLWMRLRHGLQRLSTNKFISHSLRVRSTLHPFLSFFGSIDQTDLVRGSFWCHILILF